MLEDLLKKVGSELSRREEARDKVLSRARKARQLSKQAILYIHNNNYDKAGENIVKARRLIVETQNNITDFPELDFYEEVEAANEEYAEGAILLSLEINGTYPTPEEIGVNPLRYILGLGDVPGELRREVLDELRKGNFEKAEVYLSLIEEIYTQLISMEEASLLLKGLRRKLDIMRSILESTRAEVTAEAGRRRLAETVRRLTDKLDG